MNKITPKTPITPIIPIIIERSKNLEYCFTLLPSDIKLVSYISLTMNHEAFIEYTTNMKMDKIPESSINKHENMYVFLLLALMHKNEKMVIFIYSILEKIDNKVVFDEFESAILSINDTILGNSNVQKGGAKIFDLLSLIGIIIFTAYYDYFIITNGTWNNIANTIVELQEISTKIGIGCSDYYPSKAAYFLAKHVTPERSKLVYNIDSIMNCMVTPSVLSRKLEDSYMQEKGQQIVNNLQTKLKELPGSEILELSAPKAESRELVVFGEKNQIVSNLNTKINPSLRIEDIKEKLTTLANMSPDEFKMAINPSTIPTPMPNDVPTSAPIFSRTTAFISDFTAAIQEIVPSQIQINPSLSVENMIYYTIQDLIRDTIRKMEDNERYVKRYVQDLITKATRLVSEVSTLPRLFIFLLSINTASFYAIIYFVKKFTKSSKSNERPQIENGGYRKRHSIHKLKRKTRKLKRNKNRKQTKGKKGRRVTRRQ